ncbi:MAG: phage holin family protein [Acidobacteria bacterium]|nr:phage holin family protein [Acidobacteriota bacterium]
MHNHAESNQSARSLASIVAELKHEVKDFVDTRVVMFKSELREKLAHWKVAAPLAGLGVVLLATAYLLITLSLVALTAAFIHSQYRWFFGFLGVGVLWAILGGVAAYIAKREFELSKVMPRQTLEVLKGDKVWIQQEVRNQA